MPDIVLDRDEDGWQDPDEQLDILLDLLVCVTVGVDLDLCQQLHGLLACGGLHLEAGEVAEVVLQDEEEQPGDHVPYQIGERHTLTLQNFELAVLT